MTQAPPSARGGPAIRGGWKPATVRGGLAFAAMALLGELAAFALYTLEGARLSAATVAKLGWFYVGWFHHVAVQASVPRRSLGVAGTRGGLLRDGAVSIHAGVALLLVTLLAALLLYRGGRAVADRAGGGALARVLHGAKVAPAYALPSFALSMLVSLRIQIPENALVAGTLELRSSPAEALIYPMLIAAVAGAAGGLASAREPSRAESAAARRLSGALAGGLRAFALALLLSFAGLLALAVVMPDSTKAYFQAVTEGSAAETAVLIGHHVLLLPNQSMWVLVPAMGGCDGVYGTGVSAPFLCYWRFPEAVDLAAEVTTSGQEPTRYGLAPPGYFLFLLVPLVSVVGGGRLAARRGAGSVAEAGAVGAASGAVFALLVVGGSLLASASVGLSATVGGLAGGGSVRVGPDLLTAGALGLAWGLAGGLAGGRLEARRFPSPGLESPRPDAGTGDAPG